MPPSALSLYGPLLIGVFLNTILYGVCIVQVFFYYRTYKRDAARLRYFVLYLFIIETLNTAFDMEMMYETLVINFGNTRTLGVSPKMLVTVPLMSAIISTSAQLFVARRIRIISQSLVMPIIIGFCGLSSLAGGIALSVCIVLGPDYSNFPRYEGALITWLAGAAVSDVLITISLSWSLYKRKTGIRATDDKLAEIIRLTIHTGLLTTVLAVSDLIVVLVVPGTRINFIWDLPLPKVYSNALLSTLNARSAWNGPMTAITDNHNILFAQDEISSWQRDILDTESNNRISRMGVSSKASRFSRPPMRLSAMGKGNVIETIDESKESREEDEDIKSIS